ncbi:hypothetical protein LN650_21440 [Klebsiella pneumoniae subsp. pneumoniae]|nr:hypothetical protein [Klebsiella pneumoniae subsp. pneumoniae]
MARELLRDGAEPAPPGRARRRAAAASTSSNRRACASSRTLSVSWPSSANARVNATISTIWKRCIGSWKRIASLADSVSMLQEQRMALRQELEQLQSRAPRTLMRRAPVWLAAQNSS